MLMSRTLKLCLKYIYLLKGNNFLNSFPLFQDDLAMPYWYTTVLHYCFGPMGIPVANKNILVRDGEVLHWNVYADVRSRFSRF